jgi:hypothetical protein
LFAHPVAWVSASRSGYIHRFRFCVRSSELSGCESR